MFFKRIILRGICTNCYIIADEETKDAIIIDPGYYDERITDEIAENAFNVRYIILTHGHYDHVGGVKKLVEIYKDAKVCIGKEDEEYLYDINTMFEGVPLECEFPDMKADIILNDGDEIVAGNLKIRVISTPGHTKGGVSFIIDDILISGDTLFKQSIGRTDLPGGDFAQIMDSLKKIMLLDDEINVYPGHGFSTSIKKEKYANPFVKNLL